MMNRLRSQQLLKRAESVIPGGVSSPVRAFQSVGGNPVFMEHASGPFIYDADGNRYIDYIGSWGPLILGHAHPDVVAAINKAASKGTSFGAATESEIELAEWVTRAVPSVEQIRFVNSGTEATMSALRLARGFTGRDKLVKFAGCYHGHGDAFLAEAGSGIATLGIPGSDGVPAGAAQDTLTLPYNDLDAVEQLFKTAGDTIAAVILEPIACNMGLVKPVDGFLTGLRALCTKYGALLIFDEVITGFRVGFGGAQELYGITPDLTTFGKIIGGGLPVGAYGGRTDIMNKVAPLGPVYQAGTLSGNPLAMAAGIATLEILSQKIVYQQLEESGALLEKLMTQLLKKYALPARFIRTGSVFYTWFNGDLNQDPENYETLCKADKELFGRYFNAALEYGISLAPSAFEVGFISTAHGNNHIEATVTALEQAFSQLGSSCVA